MAVDGAGNAGRVEETGSRRRPISASITKTDGFAYAMVLLALVSMSSDVQGNVLSPLVGTLATDLKLTAAETSWILNIQTIATVAVAASLARLADIFGHKRFLVGLQLLAVVGSVVAALSDSFTTLFIGRVLIGLGLVAPMAWAMVKARADADGMQSAAIMVSMVICCFTPLALILGGLLLKAGASWQSVFWIIFVVNLVLLIQAIFVHDTPETSRVRVPPDYIGGVLLAVTLLALILGLNQGNTWGWKSGRIIGLFVGALVVFILFVLQQRAARHPMMDFRGMDKRQVAAGYMTQFAIGIVAPTLFILVPAIGESPTVTGYGQGLDVLMASLPLLAILPGTILATYTSQPMMKRYGPRPTMVLGGVFVVISMLIGAFWHSSWAMLWVIVFVYIYGGVICYNVGWAMVAAAGRQDNMSLTFGMQYAIQAPAAGIIVAVVLAVMNGTTKMYPGIPVPLSADSTFRTNFLIVAVAMVFLLVVQGLVLTPRKLTHHGALPPAEELMNPVPQQALLIPDEPDTVTGSES
jgi:MFS family permease